MKVWVVPAILAATLVATPAWAKTFKVSEENPIATITIPDDWQPEEIDGGAQGTSPDDTTYIAIQAVAAADAKAATEESMKMFLKDPDTKVDDSSMQTKDLDINGRKGVDIRFTGTNKDGPQEYEITFLPAATGDKSLLITFWGSPDGDKANAAALDAIQKSLTFVK